MQIADTHVVYACVCRYASDFFPLWMHVARARACVWLCVRMGVYEYLGGLPKHHLQGQPTLGPATIYGRVRGDGVPQRCTNLSSVGNVLNVENTKNMNFVSKPHHPITHPTPLSQIEHGTPGGGGLQQPQPTHPPSET